MKSIRRTAKAGSVALVVALGLSMPAADAAGPSAETRTAHGKTDHGKTDRGSKAERKLERAARKLAREAARKDDYLARMLERHKLTRLDDEVEALVAQNIAADRAELAGLVADDAVPTTLDQVGTLADALDELRPERYHTILNDLRKALRLRVELVDAAEDATDTTDPTDTVDAATVEALIGELVTFDASTSRAELRAAKRELSQLWDAVSDDTDDDTGEADDVTGDQPSP